MLATSLGLDLRAVPPQHQLLDSSAFVEDLSPKPGQTFNVTRNFGTDLFVRNLPFA